MEQKGWEWCCQSLSFRDKSTSSHHKPLFQDIWFVLFPFSHYSSDHEKRHKIGLFARRFLCFQSCFHQQMHREIQYLTKIILTRISDGSFLKLTATFILLYVIQENFAHTHLLDGINTSVWQPQIVRAALL